MQRPDPVDAVPKPAGEAAFPGPFAALFLTLTATFTTLLIAGLMGPQLRMAAVGLGEAIGFGGVATLAARRVPEPQAERLGLRGFALRLVVPLLAVLPVVMLLSELDNWVRAWLPPSEQVAALAAEVEQLTRLDSVYAALQNAILDVGITPVVEGFLFFGVLLQGLVSHLGRLRGVALTSMLFALVRFPVAAAPGDAIVPLATSLAYGSLLSLARLASGSVLAPMLLGGALAAIGLVARALAQELPIPGFNAPGAHTPWTLVLPCAALFLAGTAALLRSARATPLAAARAASTRDGGDGEHGA